MIATTQTFYDNSTYKYRNTKARVSIDVLDLTAKSDVSDISVNAYKFYRESQLIDSNKYNKKYATGELNEFKLDGSVQLMTNTVPASEQLGWWSSLSDTSGTFTTNPRITFEFENVHSTAGITCFYDEFSFPIKSVAYWYRNGTLISYKEINNQTSNTQVFINSVNNYDKVIIEIIKAKPNSFVKMSEINFGISVIFTGDDITGAKVKEEVSTLSNTLYPNELEFTIKNYDSKYDLFNPNDLMQYFRKGQQCYAEAGVLNRANNEYEFISMGKFFIDEPSIGSGNLKIKAYGLLNKLNEETFYSPFYEDDTVEDIIDDILDGYSYYVHENVANIELTGYIPTQSKKEALKAVAIACGAVVKEGRDGRIYIYQATEELSSNQIVTDDTVYYRYGLANMLRAGEDLINQEVKPKPYVFTVGRDQRIGNIDSSMIGYYHKMDVVYKKYEEGTTSETLYDDTVITDGDGKAIIYYNDPVHDISYNTGQFTLTNYVDCSILSGLPNVTYNVTITGKKYKITESTISAVNAADFNRYDETRLTMVLDTNNELISSGTRGLAVAKWYLSQLQKRKDVKFDWWSVATVEAADTIDIETSYDENIEMQITSIEYNLSGLVAKVKGVA